MGNALVGDWIERGAMDIFEPSVVLSGRGLGYSRSHSMYSGWNICNPIYFASMEMDFKVAEHARDSWESDGAL